MAGFLLRRRRLVATAVAAMALVVVVAARWATDGAATDSRHWSSIAALVYCAVTAGLFVYLHSDRAREALEDVSDSSLAQTQMVVAMSPTVVASALHLAGADIRVLWFVLAVTGAQLVVWSELPRARGRTSDVTEP